MGFPYWSLSKWAKLKVKNAVSFIGEFERALANEANRLDADGVVCGHIHHAVIGEREGIEYINTGDWVESCTAIVEDHDGTLRLIDWAETTRGRLLEAGASSKQAEDDDEEGKRPARAA
jgi:UDP-2,3-diacylglucosamine pyrophosphatase LpxH